MKLKPSQIEKQWGESLERRGVFDKDPIYTGDMQKVEPKETEWDKECDICKQMHKPNKGCWLKRENCSCSCHSKPKETFDEKMIKRFQKEFKKEIMYYKTSEFPESKIGFFILQVLKEQREAIVKELLEK